MNYDLPNLVNSFNLLHLDDPFTSDEISSIIKEIPANKAPGLDGFNDFFMKNARTLSKWASIS
jgi:hypothetical protein